MPPQKTKLPALNRLDFAQRFREAKDIASFKEFLTLLKNYPNDIQHGSIVMKNIVETTGAIINAYRNKEKTYHREKKKLIKEIEEAKKAKYDNQTLSTSKHQKQREKVSTAERNQQQHETEQSSQLKEKDRQLINAKNENASLEAQLQHLDSYIQITEAEQKRKINEIEKKFIAEHEKVIQLQKDKEDLSKKLKKAEENATKWQNNYRLANNYARDMADKNQKLCLKIKSATAGFGEKTKMFVNEILCNTEKVSNLFGDPAIVPNDNTKQQDENVCYSSRKDNHFLREHLYEPPPKRIRRLPCNSASRERYVPDDSSFESETDD